MGIKAANPTPQVGIAAVTKQVGDSYKVEVRYYDNTFVGEHASGDLSQPVVEFVKGNDGFVRLGLGSFPNGAGTVFAIDSNGKIELV